MTDIRFSVPLIPSTFTQMKAKRIADDFATAARAHAPAMPFTGPIALELDFCLPAPASWPKWRRMAVEQGGLVHHAERPGLGRLVKLAIEELTRTGRFWRDDAHIVSLQARKSYSRSPSTLVRITAATPRRACLAAAA